MASVTFEHVTKTYGSGTHAVDDLQLEIADGEFLVLVGPSGCGKSTALRMVAGLERISGGRILIGERVVNNVAPMSRDVAMVFQSYALYPHMTVYDNLAFGLRNKKVPKQEIERRVEEGAKILDLEGLLQRKPKQLSGGQRQRVALGRAIVREPAVWLMDEPLSNLDAALRVATRAEILKLHQRVGTTTIYVTHDQVEAMTMGDRIAVMKLGVLQQTGTPEELYTRPQNVFVAGFIGSPAMNLVPVERAAENGNAVLRSTDSEGLAVRVPERFVDAAQAAGQRQMIVGLRPEHLTVANGSAPNAATLPVVVDVVEYLGDEQLVHLHAGETPLVAKLSVEPRLAAEQSVTLAIPLHKLYLFDRETESALAVSA
jgi:multiple sugar transport system ATP-binding protein